MFMYCNIYCTYESMGYTELLLGRIGSLLKITNKQYIFKLHFIIIYFYSIFTWKAKDCSFNEETHYAISMIIPIICIFLLQQHTITVEKKYRSSLKSYAKIAIEYMYRFAYNITGTIQLVTHLLRID